MPRAKKVKTSDTSVKVVEMSEETAPVQRVAQQSKTPTVARVSIVLEYELPLASFANTSGDTRDILLSRAKQHWMGEVGSIGKDRALFETV